MSNKIISKLKKNKIIYSTAIKTKYYINKKNAIKNRIGNISTFHTTRCGSSVVGLMLNQHPDIYWDNEIIRRIKFCTHRIQQEPEEYITNKMYANNSKYYGFETTKQHLGERFLNMELENYINLLKDFGFKYFINLQRKNHLKKLVSNSIGKKTKKFHSKNETPTITKIKLNLDSNNKSKKSLIQKFEDLDKYYNTINNLLENENSIKLVYEDDILNNPYIAYQKIINFIGLNDFKPEIMLKKQNPFALEEIIINYEQVRTLLTDTKYEWMLKS